jgi:hypothetical protein
MNTPVRPSDALDWLADAMTLVYINAKEKTNV